MPTLSGPIHLCGIGDGGDPLSLEDSQALRGLASPAIRLLPARESEELFGCVYGSRTGISPELTSAAVRLYPARRHF